MFSAAKRPRSKTTPCDRRHPNPGSEPFGYAGTSLQFELESLEAREMLAGDVTAVLTSQGDLRITGDSEGNSVHVFHNADGNIYMLGTHGTTVNGQGGNVMVTDVGGAAVPRNLIINMKGGDDRVTLREFHVMNNLTADMGTGNDSLMVSRILIDNDANLKGGSGDGSDLLQVIRSTVQDRLTVNGQAGDDVLSIGNSVLGGQATVQGGDGNDTLFVDAIVFDKFEVDLGGGTDVLVAMEIDTISEQADIKLGSGNDAIFVHSANNADVKLNGGGGEDQMFLHPGADFDGPQSAMEATIINVATDASIDGFGANLLNFYVTEYDGDLFYYT